MAATPSPFATPPSDATVTANSDPFVDHSARKANRGSLEALMAAIQQVSTDRVTSRSPRFLSHSSYIPQVRGDPRLATCSQHDIATRSLRIRYGYCSTQTHTFKGCTTTSLPSGETESQHGHSQPCSAPRAVYPHHYASLARQLHLPNVRQVSRARLALRLPPGLAYVPPRLCCNQRRELHCGSGRV